MDWGQIILGVGGGGAVAALIAALAGRGKNRADAAATLVGASTETIKALRGEIEQIQADVSELRGEIRELRSALATEEARRRHAIHYIRVLVDLIHDIAPGTEMPAPPEPLREIL